MKKDHTAKRSWRVLALALCLAMLAGLLPTVALADVSSTIKLDNATYYPSGALKSINITYTGWTGTTYNITSRLLLSTVQLNAKTTAKPTHGDYTDFGTYGKVYKTYDALMSSTAATSTFGILNATNAENPGASSSSPKTWTFNFKESDIPLDQNKDYFITVWTNYSGYFFPDSLLCGIRVRDGVVRYAEAYQNVIDESKYGFVENVNTYTVKVTPGAHMTKTTDSGEAAQTGNTGITPIVYTADTGYYFPDNYTVPSVSNIHVRRDSASQITVYGTPLANANITLAAATEEPRSTDQVLVNGQTLSQDTPYIASNSITPLTEAPTTGGYAYFDAVNGILELHNFELDGGSIKPSATYYDKTNLTIKLEGTNKLTDVNKRLSEGLITTDNTSSSKNIDVAIVGPGSLYAENDSSFTTVYVQNGDLTVKDGANVTLKHNGGMGETMDANSGSIIITGSNTVLNAVNAGGAGARTTSTIRVNKAKVYLSGKTYAVTGDPDFMVDETDTVYGSTDGKMFREISPIDVTNYNYLKVNDADDLVYDVTWNANGGKFGAKDTQVDTLVCYKAITPPTTPPTRAEDGDYTYTFKGWSESAEEGSLVIGEGAFGTVNKAVTFYAQWTKTEKQKTFTITWNANGGKFSATNMSTQDTTVDEGATITPPTAPTQKGYEFKGWKDASGNEWTASTTATASVTYYAQWTPNEYKVTLDPKGGEIENGTLNGNGKYEMSYTYGVGLTLPTKDQIKKTGYDFKGWYDYTGFEYPYSSIGDTASGDKSYYAKWEEHKYEIKYELDSGTLPEGVKNPGTYTIETPSFKLNNPTRTGYTFEGWTEPGNTTPTKDVTIFKGSTGNLKFTATWTPIVYNISYAGMDGATHGDKHPATHTYGTATEISNPTKTGYDFAGWKIGSDETPYKNLVLRSTSLYSDPITLTATWTPSTSTAYTVKHELEQLDGSYKLEETETPTGTTGEQVTPAVKSYTGFTAPEKQQLTITADGKATLTYKYTRNTYEITYKWTDETGESTDTSTEKYETEVTMKLMPDETGYTFSGWTAPEGVTVTADGKFTMPAKNVTFTADYTANKYDITYTGMDGAEYGTNHPTKHTYGSETEVSDPTKVGYTFTGWKINGSTTAVKNLTLGAKDYTANITLEATWTANKYDITYTGMDGAEYGTNHPTKHTYGSETVFSDPTKVGYTFTGWKINGSTPAVKSLTLGATEYTANITLEATWKANEYDVTLIEKTSTYTNTITTLKHTYGEVTKLLTADQISGKPGYTFGGWYDNEAFNGTAVTEIGATEIGNKTFYLKWTPNTDTKYKVVHELEKLDGTYKVEETETLTGTTNATVTPLVKSYTGFTAPTTQAVTIAADGSTTVTYKYTRNSYTLTYEWFDETGTKHTEPQEVKFEQSVTPKTMPEVTGYTFSGWTSTSVDASGAFNMPHAAVTLTGKYTANTYKITYLGMDKATHGTYHPDTHTYDTATVISNPARKDYRFLGWSINGSSKTYVDLTLGAKDYTADITLTAVWQLDIDPKYDVKLPNTGKGNVSVRPDPAGEADAVIITVQPDDGYVVKDVEVVDKDGNRLPVRDLGDNRFSFIMPKGDVTVNVTYTERRGFDDVFVRDYYYDAVNWAVENGITEGVGNNLFAPGALCTRAQVVTFLWRSAGCPKAVSRVNPFTDVSRSAYYYEAVLWAVENGVTEGMSETTFEPDAVCTRAQVVTFLYRMFRESAATGSTGFNDVPDGAWYAEAVKWAVDNGITTGVGKNLFAPNDKCTRGQIVTFLWRAYTQR